VGGAEGGAGGRDILPVGRDRCRSGYSAILVPIEAAAAGVRGRNVILYRSPHGKAEPYILEAHKRVWPRRSRDDDDSGCDVRVLRSVGCAGEVPEVLSGSRTGPGETLRGNPVPLLWTLRPEASALQALGKTEEAEKVEARIREIEASAKAN
jgi:hypothetical protein